MLQTLSLSYALHCALHALQLWMAGSKTPASQAMIPCFACFAAVEGGKQDSRFPGNDPPYSHIDPAKLPLTESLQLTVERVLPYWSDTIAPALKSGKNVIVVAHGNSIRVSCPDILCIWRQVCSTCMIPRLFAVPLYILLHVVPSISQDV